MKRRGFLMLAPAAWAASSGAAAAAPARNDAAARVQPLDPGAWSTLRTSLAGRPAVVHLWGVSCAPCIGELPRWATFVDAHPGAQIVFVQVDPAGPAAVEATLRRAGLRGAQQWSLQGLADERWQYAVDPGWGGELPRTLLLDAAGRARAFSGAADFRRLDGWLRRGR